MKLKKAKIIVKNIKDIKSEWKKAMKGEVKKVQKKNEFVFTTLDIAAKIFSKNKMLILQAVALDKPKSIYELSKILNKDFKSVYTDVKFLSTVGLIELIVTEDARSGLRPIAKFSGIEFEWAA